MRRTKKLRATQLTVLSGLAVAGATACASADDPNPQRETGEQSAAITTACAERTFGMPCDPDGAGSATECQGICWLNAAGSPACLGVAAVGMTATNLNGRVCGDATGSDCGQSCENGACVNLNARVGSACIVAGIGNTCGG
ncbi:MAG TPA: hypothetical protein VK524_21170, partial [Polyangiaceae bacterium]|nr:hypothetical protein [Polyangiaceae bacterium]